MPVEIVGARWRQEDNRLRAVVFGFCPAHRLDAAEIEALLSAVERVTGCGLVSASVTPARARARVVA